MEDISILSQKTDDELYAEIGARLLGESSGFGPQDFERFARFGRSWFEDRLEEFREQLCLLPQVVQFLRSPMRDRIADATAIVDMLASMKGYSFHPVAIAILVARFGLDTLCADASS